MPDSDMMVDKVSYLIILWFTNHFEVHLKEDESSIVAISLVFSCANRLGKL